MIALHVKRAEMCVCVCMFASERVGERLSFSFLCLWNYEILYMSIICVCVLKGVSAYTGMVIHTPVGIKPPAPVVTTQH